MTLRERRRPRRLRPGDTVAVVAPAGPVPPDLLESGVRLLESWDLRVQLGEYVTSRHPRLEYLAGTDAQRAFDLQRAWCDPHVDAVLCARGGYGALRTLDHLDFAAMAAAEPKVFAGSSDITVLHEAFAAHLDVVTVFGPLVATKAFVEDASAREHLRRTLFEPHTTTIITRSTAGTLVRGRSRGVTAGGNVSLLAGTLGAAGAAPPRGTVALLEDITEDPYRIDRFLTQLLRAGWFDRVSGIALGSWSECGPLDKLREMLWDRLSGLGVPIVWELGFGHGPAARTVPLGVAVELDAEAGRLTVLNPALE